MGNDFHLKPLRDPVPDWVEIQALTNDWNRQKRFPPGIPVSLQKALGPYLRWTVKLMVEGVPWRARWHILFTGRFPADL